MSSTKDGGTADDATRYETQAPVDPNLSADVGPPVMDSRYEAIALLGKGGMGEVRLCRDERLGRTVAMKAMRGDRPADPELLSRFWREARLQAQLQHPSIVPVYDAGRDEKGAPFFTMKHMSGKTLRAVLDGAGDNRAHPFSRRALLDTFCQVCLAVDFAHARSVVHRDLKPANIMLGDFGEVVVLDWGIAKASGDVDVETVPTAASLTLSDDLTGDGAVLGTHGYLSPERLRGAPASVVSDVYALGAILFELLTLNRLGAGTQDVRAQLVDAGTAPELAAACAQAVAADPQSRTRSARSLCDDIRAYLDGERDASLRATLADDHIKKAKQAKLEDPAALTGALRELGRALAIDPGNLRALTILREFLDVMPREMPPEVAAASAASEVNKARFGARNAALTFASTFLFLPLCFVMGVRSPGAIMCFYGVVAAALAMPVLVLLGIVRPSRPSMLFATGLGTCLVATASLVVSPLLLLPAWAVGSASAAAVLLERRDRVLVLVAHALAMIVPVAVELAGLVPRSFRFTDDGALVILPRALGLAPGPTVAFLLGTSIAALTAAVLSAAQVGDTLRAAERKLLLQTWQLKQLAPAVDDA